MLLLSTVIFNVAAATDPSERRMREKYTNTANTGNGSQTVNDIRHYAEIEESYAGYKNYSGSELTYTVDDIIGSDQQVGPHISDFGNPSRKSFLWDETVQWIEWEIEAPESALYNFKIGYYAYNVSTLDAVREFYIDGRIPYQELSNLAFKWNWIDAGEPTINAMGDESIPSQQLKEQWNDKPVCDQEGYYAKPLNIYLTAGSHKIRMAYVQQAVALSGISLTAPEELPGYSQVLAQYKAAGYKDAGAQVRFEAESSVTGKNSPNLSRVANYDPRTSPYAAGYRRLNAMGDNYWYKGGQEITWSFTVPEDGLYRIDMRILASFTNGLPVYRRISVDGKVPFREMLEYEFDYTKDWRIQTLSDKAGAPYLFYFNAGTEHTLSMAVMSAEYTDLIISLNYDAQLFSSFLLDVSMLTGTSPDVNYEYEIVRNIPETAVILDELITSLEWKVETLAKLSGGRKTPAANSLEQIISLIRQVRRDPESIPKQLNNLIENQTSLTMWYTNLQFMPMAIDYFEVKPAQAAVTDAVSRWYEKAWSTFRSFLVSFVKDYNNVGVQINAQENGSTLINVWVSTSTEAAEILRNLIDDSFSPQTGIYANLNLLPAGQLNAGAVNSLMLSIVSGVAPDAAIGVGPSTPVELAIRGSAKELSSMDGYEEFSSQFLPEGLVPLTFNQKVYGIPERMDFRLMFYRKDIFESLGLKVPDTWNELYSTTLQVLKQNQLEVFIPQDLSMFLFQSGGHYFTEDGLKSAFDTSEGYKAFEEMVQLYTNYGVPYTAAFFNRFRIGSIPVGIGGYSDYISLLIGAPELAGKWGIALIPGHESADGTINRSWSGSTMSSSMILAQTAYPEESWEFIKWWMGSQTQSRYAREVETRIGLGSRVNTANTVAFKELAWRGKDLSIITDTWNWIVETPGVLGGPYVSRHVNNAWNRIIVDQLDMTVRDSFDDAIEEINKELLAKQEEYPQLVTGVNIYD